MRLRTFTTTVPLHSSIAETAEANFSNGELNLTIEVRNADEALAFLGMLSTARLEHTHLGPAFRPGVLTPEEPGPARGGPPSGPVGLGARERRATGTAPAPSVGEPEPAPADVADLLAAPAVDRGNLAALAATAPAKAAAPPKAPKPSKRAERTVFDDATDAPGFAPGEAPESTPEAAAAALEEAPTASQPTSALPDEVLNARKLRDVLSWLQEQGVVNADEMKAWCADHKQAIPALERITDLDARIDRALEVMDMSDG